MSSSPMVDVSHSQESAAPAPSRSGMPSVLVCLPSGIGETLPVALDHLAQALPGLNLLVTSPDAPSEIDSGHETIRILPYPSQAQHSGWVLTSADYSSAANLLREHNAEAAILLGPETTTLSAAGLRALCAAIINDGADLALPRYEFGPHEGLVNAAMMYPLSSALFGIAARIPLPVDAAFSTKMAARLAVAGRKPAATPGTDALLWPAAEAAVGSLTIHEVSVGHRVLPPPGTIDLNTILAQIASSLFADLESKAAFWQRARSAPPVTVQPGAPLQGTMRSEEDFAEVASMAASFRIAYTNLQEIWSLVLPPQSLLAFKKLSLSSPENFSMPTNLWARTVYDFVLAYRLRTINRGHLLGALTPLYLAWVASHLRRSDGDQQAAERHIEDTAAAFVAEKPYILARWRWPDRFNP